MTDRVNPSINTVAEARLTSAVIQYLGLIDTGWVVPSTDDLMATEAGLSGAPLNAFNSSHSTSSLTPTIDTGEAFVAGAWLGADTTTNVTLAASTAGQTVYLGYDTNAADTVLIGLSGAFASDDPKIPLWTYDTDGSGVTTATDDRVIGRPYNVDTAGDLVDQNGNVIYDFSEASLGAGLVPALQNFTDTDIFTGYPLASSDIGADSISSSELASGSVDSTHIVSDAVTASKIAANAVGGGEIASGAVGFSEIADNAVLPTHFDPELTALQHETIEVDTNSGTSFSSSVSFGTPLDYVVLRFNLASSDTNSDVKLRVNGHSGTDYVTLYDDGGSLSGSSSWDIGQFTASGHTVSGEIHLRPKYGTGTSNADGNFSAFGPVSSFGASTFHHGQIVSTSTIFNDIDNVNLFTTGNAQGEAQVLFPVDGGIHWGG